jgi:omega-6 fatty acid desaturase (delta-12 desaturase)
MNSTAGATTQTRNTFPSPIQILKDQKRAIARRYSRASDARAMFQVLTTIAFLAVAWAIALYCVDHVFFLTPAAILLISLLTVRSFTLMHECGHRSLFRTPRLNRAFGFLLGVISGMPQYVWSRHHDFHHATNGNWDKYRGLYTTLSIDEYSALSKWQQRVYRGKCSITFAPVAGLIYSTINPRINWLRGSVSLVRHMGLSKLKHPEQSMKAIGVSFQTRYWKTRKEYWQMFWNNVVLLSALALLCWAFGTARFLTIYVISAAIAGGIGVILFTVQHNFEGSYASDSSHWDYDTAAIDGTSFLMLPAWLNWFTANIGYHHVHHLSSKIPNYMLISCHNENRQLFDGVPRLNLSQIPKAMKCILWDTRTQRIIPVAEYRLAA